MMVENTIMQREQRENLGCLEVPAIILLAIAGSIMIAFWHFRQHRIEHKFAKSDFAAVVLREYNSDLKERQVAGCQLASKPAFTIKDGEGTRKWFKVVKYNGPGIRPAYIEQISATADYDKEIKGVIYAAFSGKSAATDARRWLSNNHYSDADTEWATHFQFQSPIPTTVVVEPRNGESEIGLWVSLYSLEKVYLWNGSSVTDMTDNAQFISNYTSAIQKLKH
jgi:hypothetical protein